MQHATLPDSRTTCGTGNGGYPFGREFAPPHVDKMRSNPVANLFSFGQHRYWLLQTGREVLLLGAPSHTQRKAAINGKIAPTPRGDCGPGLR
jgi:hypothetical protein